MKYTSCKNTIIFPIEIKKREFLSRLLMAAHAVNDGHPVVIGDRDGCHREMDKFKGYWYLAKSLSFDLKPIFKKIKRNNGKIMVLFEEGGYVLRQNNKYQEVKSFYPEKMLPYVDYILTYGKGYQELLIEKFKGLDYSNTVISGNARFDLHKPKYHSLFEKEVKEIKQKYGQYILVNTNFGLANHSLGEEFIANEFQNSKDFTSELITYYLQMQKDQKKDLMDFSQMIKNISKANINITFIVRPHPIENLDFYNELYKEVPNIIVKSEGTAVPWIIGSELVIHKDCTTGLESFFAKKPIISYQPSEDSNMLWLPPLVSDIAKTESEVVLKINEYLSKKNTFKIADDSIAVLSNEIKNTNCDTSSLFLELIKKSNRNDSSKNQTHFKAMDKGLKVNYKRARNIIRWYRAKYLKKNIYARSFEGLDKKEIISYLKIISEIERFKFEYKVKALGKNTFFIEKDIN